MTAVGVTVGGRTTVFEGRQVLRIGRALDADVRVDRDTVSPSHAELRETDLGWILVDVGSKHGTYVGERRLTELRVSGRERILLGLSGSGAIIEIDPHPYQARPEAAPTPAAARVGATRPPPIPLDAAFALTMQRRPGEFGPDDPLFPDGRTGPALRIEGAGQVWRFDYPAEILIGRLPNSSVVLRDPGVSREHARVDPVDGHWLLTNVSKAGTFVHGHRQDRIQLDARTTIRLGHPDAGLELTLLPESRNDSPPTGAPSRRLRGLALGAVGLVLVGVIAAVALRSFDSPEQEQEQPSPPTAAAPPNTPGPSTPTPDRLDQAKLATVRITAESETTDGRRVVWSGSGTIISADGLVLTNAHVADPQADGLDELYGRERFRTPPFVRIALMQDPDGSAAAPMYRARVVASDGTLDAAVLRIFATTNGTRLTAKLNLPTLALGDSDLMRTGDAVTVLGFPGISGSKSVSVSRGVISTVIADPKTGVDRAEFDTDARIAPGNSGGPAINDAGLIVGIPSSLVVERGTWVSSGRIRPINLVRPLIERAETDQPGGEPPR